MPLVIVKETGTGNNPAANSYATVADADAYAASRLNSTAWTGATDTNKTIALVMATRTIDTMYQFKGVRVYGQVQPLQWPRAGAYDPDSNNYYFPVLSQHLGQYFPSDQIPAVVIAATCELAMQLLTVDRTGDPQGTGIKRFKLDGAMEVEFDKHDQRAVIPALVQTMLSRAGQYMAASGGHVKMTRA